MYELEFETLLAQQKASAKGQRLELLCKDKTGEQKLFCSVLFPVLQTFEGLEMEHEMVSLTGVRIYGDFFWRNFRFVVETEGYGVHGEMLTRDRHSFEKMRVRTMMSYGYKFIPFSWDDIDKRPEACRRYLYQLIGQYSTNLNDAFMALSVYEREVLRNALRLEGRISFTDACYRLQLGSQPTRKVLRSLVEKQLLKPLGSGLQRHHTYELLEKGRDYLLSQ